MDAADQLDAAGIDIVRYMNDAMSAILKEQRYTNISEAKKDACMKISKEVFELMKSVKKNSDPGRRRCRWYMLMQLKIIGSLMRLSLRMIGT